MRADDFQIYSDLSHSRGLETIILGNAPLSLVDSIKNELSFTARISWHLRLDRDVDVFID